MNSIAYASASPQETTDLSHLKTLAICHYVLGGLMMLFSSVFIFHIAIGVAIVTGGVPINTPPGATPPPFDEKWFGAMFIIGGSVAVLFGWTMGIFTIISGRDIHRLRRRTFSFVVAGIECIFFPLGTLLGIFTFIVLSRQSVILLYSAQTQTR